MSIFDLTGKKAIVTGGSRGLGHGMAEGLMEAGCEVVIIGTRESIKDRADEFNQKGLKCTGVQADLGDEIALKEAFPMVCRVDIHQRNFRWKTGKECWM